MNDFETNRFFGALDEGRSFGGKVTNGETKRRNEWGGVGWVEGRQENKETGKQGNREEGRELG